MIWHITKRELYDNLNSLRFALATVLLLALMLTNAVVHLREQPVRMQKYRDAATQSLNALTSRTDLYDLAQKGPQRLYKKPSLLRFCTDGGDSLLPTLAHAASHFWGDRDLKCFWRMTYPPATPNLKNIDPDATKIDWAFVIGYVLSLIALLFTFDAVSGEREHGTLRLMLANSIPRHTVLIGKFLGAFISVNIPLVIAVLMNLLLISTSSAVHLGTEEWGRLGDHHRYRDALFVSLSRIRTLSICACETECCEPCNPPAHLGEFCDFSCRTHLPRLPAVSHRREVTMRFRKIDGKRVVQFWMYITRSGEGQTIRPKEC